MKSNVKSKAIWIILQSITASAKMSNIYPRISTCSVSTIFGMNQSPKSANLFLKTLDIRGGGGGGGDRDFGYSDDYNSRGRYDDMGGGRNGRSYYDDDDDRYGSQQQGYDDRYGSARRGERYEDDYYGESQDYKERNYTPSSSRQSSKPSPLSKIPDVGGILRNGNKKIGFALLGGGMIFTMLGISLFFNKSLMRLGNLFFIAGVPMTIGPGRTTGYFLQPKKSRATGCLALGIFLVFIGWPIFGIALEIFGLLNLFGNMFPIFMVILKQMPFVGNILNGNSGGKSAKKNDRKASSRDRYSYEDEEYNENIRDNEDGAYY